MFQSRTLKIQENVHFFLNLGNFWNFSMVKEEKRKIKMYIVFNQAFMKNYLKLLLTGAYSLFKLTWTIWKFIYNF